MNSQSQPETLSVRDYSEPKWAVACMGDRVAGHGGGDCPTDYLLDDISTPHLDDVSVLAAARPVIELTLSFPDLPDDDRIWEQFNTTGLAQLAASLGLNSWAVGLLNEGVEEVKAAEFTGWNYPAWDLRIAAPPTATWGDCLAKLEQIDAFAREWSKQRGDQTKPSKPESPIGSRE